MGLLAAILPFVPSVVKLVEGLFSGKAKSGTDKMDAALQAVRALLEKFGAVQGVTDKPTDDALRGAIEAVVQQLKGSGELTAATITGTTTPPNVITNAWLVVGGTVMPIQIPR